MLEEGEDQGEIVSKLNNLSAAESDNWRSSDHKNPGFQSICRNLKESIRYPSIMAWGLNQFSF